MTKADELLMQKFDRIIEENFENPTFSIESACLEIGISRSQLHRILKEQFKLSTSLYIRKKKLHKAKELLKDNELKIVDVSSKVGIDSPQNFSKYFINEYGISPTEFRRKQHENEEPSHVSFEAPDIENPVAPKRQVKYLYYIAVVLLMVILIVYIRQKVSDQSKTDLIGIDINANAIAVLPFVNLGDSTNAYFSEGITDQIRSALASASEFKVISNFSSNEYRNSKKSISHIANELAVSYILKGDVLQNDSLLTINIKLYNGKDNSVIWVKKYNGNTKKIFVFLDEASEKIAFELSNKLDNGFKEKLKRAPQTSLPAFNAYLQGRKLMHYRDKERLEGAIAKFNKAIELDSTFADAYAEKANAYFLLADGAYTVVSTSLALSEQNAKTAIRIDYTNAIAYATLGNIFKDRNNWKEANATYLSAIKYEPNNALVNYWYSLMLRITGRLDKAIEYSTKATTLDPLHPVISAGHILNCVYGNKPELAEKSIIAGELLFNDSWTFNSSTGVYHMIKKEYSLALMYFNKASELNPKVRIIKNTSVYCQVKLGQRKEVEDFLKSLADIPENYSIKAMIYASFEDRENTLRYLEKRAETGSIPSDMKVLPTLNFLHGDKRFEALLQKFGLGEPIVYPQ